MKQFDLAKLVKVIKANLRSSGMASISNRAIAESWYAAAKPEWLNSYSLDMIKQHLASLLSADATVVIEDGGIFAISSAIVPVQLDFDRDAETLQPSTVSNSKFWRAVSGFLNSMTNSNFNKSGLSLIYANAHNYGEAFLHMVDSTGNDVVTAIDLIKTHEPQIFKSLNLKFKEYMNSSLSSVLRLCNSNRARAFMYARDSALETIDIVLSAGSVEDASGVAELRSLTANAQSFVELDSALSLLIDNASFSDALVSEKLRLIRLTIQPDLEEQVRRNLEEGLTRKENVSLEDFEETVEDSETEPQSDDIVEDSDEAILDAEDFDFEDFGDPDKVDLDEDDVIEQDPRVLGVTDEYAEEYSAKFAKHKNAMRLYADDKLRVNSKTFDWMKKSDLLPDVKQIDLEERQWGSLSKSKLLTLAFEIIEEFA